MAQLAVISILVIILVLTIILLVVQIKQLFFESNMYLDLRVKLANVIGIILYILFDIAQILNYSLSMKNNCKIWNILSMIILWIARLSFCLEILRRTYFILQTAPFRHFHTTRKFKTFAFILVITYIIFILLTSIFYPISVIKEGICLSSYNKYSLSYMMMIVMSVYSMICLVGSATYLTKALYDGMRYTMDYSKHQQPLQLTYIMRKVSIFTIIVAISSCIICLIVLYLYQYTVYGILLCFDGLIILFIHIIVYNRKNQKIFDMLFCCFIKRHQMENPQRVRPIRFVPQKSVIEISQIANNKFCDEYKPIIIKTLKQHTNPYIADEIIDIIIIFLMPIRFEDNYNNKLYRPFWKPETMKVSVAADNIQYIKSSKFGGIPYLSLNETWPKCISCNKSLHFCLQINMNDLPIEYKNEWLSSSQRDIYSNCLLQYFQCIDIECQEKVDDNTTCDNLLRFISMNGDNDYGDDEKYDETNNFDHIFQQYNHANGGTYDPRLDAINTSENALIITNWEKAKRKSGAHLLVQMDEMNEKKPDYIYELPSKKEYNEIYLGIFEDWKALENKDVYRVYQSLQVYESDKLFGYTDDEIELPLCNICDNRMNHMIFQIGDNDKEIEFYNGRIGAIFICDNHPSEVKILFNNKRESLLSPYINVSVNNNSFAHYEVDNE